MFVLNFECLKDFVATQIREFYSDVAIKDGEICYEETESYKTEVRALENNIENASLRWFVNMGAITEDDYNLYQKIRQRRNEIIHELLKNLSDGFTENDALLFGEMLRIYQKIDEWWINEIEIPTSSETIPEGYDPEGVCGGQALVLDMINDIILENNKKRYKRILDELKKIGAVK